MDLFRKKQKLIFWIITIIIVPSFVLVWGVQGNPFESPQEAVIAEINGNPLSYSDYERFRRRFRTALGDMTFRFAGLRDIAPEDDVLHHVAAYAMIRDAEAASIEAVDKWVGTYLRYSYPPLAAAAQGGDEAAFDRAVTAHCSRHSITRAEFFQGVREWLSLQWYLQLDNNTVNATPDTAYVWYAVQNTNCVVKRLRIPETDALREQAKGEFNGKTEEEAAAAVRAHVAEQSGDDKYRDPAGWQFEYIMIPFPKDVPAGLISDADIDLFYQTNREALYGDQPLDAVRDAVREALTQQERERLALRDFSVTIDETLHRLASSEQPPQLDELSKLTALTSVGAETGVIGREAPLSTGEIGTNDIVGSNPVFTEMLLSLDRMAPESRDAFVAKWKREFDTTDRPLRGPKGLVRLRLVQYEPSRPVALEDADGKINKDIFEKAATDLIAQRTAELLSEQIRTTEQEVRTAMEARMRGEKNESVAEIEAALEDIPDEILSYSSLTEATAPLTDVPVGDMLPPVPYTDGETGETGQELLIVVGRQLPDRRTFDAEPEDVRLNFLNGAIGMRQGFMQAGNALQGPTLLFKPSGNLMSSFWDRMRRGDIRIYTELFSQDQSEETPPNPDGQAS